MVVSDRPETTRARNASSPGNLSIGHGLHAFVQVVTPPKYSQNPLPARVP